MTRVRTRTFLPALLLGVVVSGCDTLFGPEDPASIEIVASRSTVDVPGDTIMLRAVVRDEEGEKISGARVAWESLDPTVVTVDGAGVARGVSNGAARVVARSGGVADSLEITVDTPIACAPVGDLVVPDTIEAALEEGDCRLQGIRGDFWRLALDGTIEITIEMKAQELDAVLVLLDDAGDLIAVDDDGGIGLNARLHGVLPAGTYYVFATSYQADGIGTYRISAFEGGYPSPCPATATLQPPDTVSGEVTADDCVYEGVYIDSWRVDLPVDTTLVLQLAAKGIQPLIAVGDTLGGIFTGSAHGPGSDAWIELRMRAGSYDIWVSDATSAGASGSYTLSALLGRPTRTCATQGAIAPGETVTGEITYEDCYISYGSAEGWDLHLEESRTLQMSMHAEGLYPTILVSDSSGRVLEVAWGDSARADMELTLRSGSYRVWARAEHDLTGSYTLTVGADGQLPACEASGQLAPGDTVQDALSTADCLLTDGRFADLWTVRLDTASLITVGLESGELDAFLLVADSLRQTIDMDDDGGGSNNARLTLALEPGLYQLWATSHAPDETGAYSLYVVPGESGAVGAAPVMKDGSGSTFERPRWVGRSDSAWPGSAVSLPWRPVAKQGLPPPWLRPGR